MHLETCRCGNPPEHTDGSEHHWSGWPGAYCLDCFAPDVLEECIAGGCKCPCHDRFWAAYEAQLEKEE